MKNNRREGLFQGRGVVFMSIYFLIFVIGTYWAFGVSKEQSFLYINELHFPLGDFFFAFFTHLGDGLAFIILAIFLFFIKRYYGLLAVVCYAVSGIASQFLKRVVFSDVPRPALYFGKDFPLNYVDGVELAYHNSLPSGHTTTAFSMFLLLAILFPHRWAQAVFFVMACLVGLSRMYLCQHFYFDVYTGSLLGISCTWVVYLYIENRTQLSQHPWFQYSAIQSLPAE